LAAVKKTEVSTFLQGIKSRLSYNLSLYSVTYYTYGSKYLTMLYQLLIDDEGLDEGQAVGYSI
jgi:hypothetical protein